MLHKIDLDDDTSALLESLTRLTGLNVSELIDRRLSAQQAEEHELLALIAVHPELREQAANLLQSFGPEPLLVGIKRIAPCGYLTLAERFERQMSEVMGELRTAS
jgi:hypothetical protein